MNHIYRLVFNRALGLMQVASETTRSRGKSGGRQRSRTVSQPAGLQLRPLAAALLLVAAGTVAQPAMATTYTDIIGAIQNAVSTAPATTYTYTVSTPVTGQSGG